MIFAADVSVLSESLLGSPVYRHFPDTRTGLGVSEGLENLENRKSLGNGDVECVRNLRFDC